MGYYITTPVDHRPIKVLIKGLPRNTSIEVVKNELTNNSFEVEKVAQLRSFRDRTPLPMFLIHLTPGPNVDKITTMFFLDVTVEKYERPARVSQCYRCQSFNHGSSVCQMASRCVKCAGFWSTAGGENEERFLLYDSKTVGDMEAGVIIFATDLGLLNLSKASLYDG
ncbi:hypothetical protein JTE90_029257 [Oedothorax gibbosus]|uniref:Pre-C2HC domain-containing protein n=1 Tax=Oedothorax gibbosus TaxID=931172 RepID=A0AAV6TWH0_9ARAC|nr:hypothetical protein JTE90_029257 [Oedothorax gibbosus]